MKLLQYKEIKMIFLAQLFICASNYIFVPFLAVYLTEALSFSLVFVGGQVAIKLVSQRGFMIFGGMLADRIGSKYAVYLTIALRFVALLLFFSTPSSAQVTLASLLLGISTAIFIPASKLMFTTLSTCEDRVKIFSMRSMVNNIGVGIGSLIGSVLISSSVSVLVGITVIFSLLAVFFIESNYKHSYNASTTTENKEASLPAVKYFLSSLKLLRNQIITLAVFLSIGSNAIYVQIESIVPLFINDNFDEHAVGYFFFINSMVIIFLQLPLNTYISKRMGIFSIISLGFLGYAVGMLGFAYSSHLIFLLAFTVIYTFGEIFIDPYVDTLISNHAPDHRIGTGFGLIGFGGVIGGIIGSVGSTSLLTWIGYDEYWLLSSIFALLFVCVSMCCHHTKSIKRLIIEQ